MQSVVVSNFTLVPSAGNARCPVNLGLELADLVSQPGVTPYRASDTGLQSVTRRGTALALANGPEPDAQIRSQKCRLILDIDPSA